VAERIRRPVGPESDEVDDDHCREQNYCIEEKKESEPSFPKPRERLAEGQRDDVNRPIDAALRPLVRTSDSHEPRS